ncbi:GlcNAc-PI de-N-acetylase [Acrocarpospora phusangensis]|uniref:GlcNAc-PI de-N-acetylase n=1 Tax=Acrocarpospora phusangensis TaxID=1070424 RepID=A0A919QG29_9ACTN|nr:PIG-L family deacetylase [Acrocarpospora phusangensis]GIH27204.1 GlcNAc-PI de-N-acetylase [Acrocarpospora phusangensis]
MDRELTVMAVHAHPDDEVMGTGGMLARYAEEGIRTVLVTCTNGEQGDGPGGVKPGEPGHDDAEVARVRLGELRESAAHLGITHVETLGFRDSGMDGWDGNGHDAAFANVPVDIAAARLGDLIRRYQPQVVVTYNEKGGYGHPDHIQAHRIAVAAVAATGIPDKFYYQASPRSWMEDMITYMAESGMDTEGWENADDFTDPDDQITSVLDVAAYFERKIKAISAHASQGDSEFFLNMPDALQRRVFAAEAYIRQWSKVPAPDHEDDLFAGIRGS